MNLWSTILIVFIISGKAYSQKKYWITFKDKNIASYNYLQQLSCETIKNRKIAGLPLMQYTDIPVNSVYTNNLVSQGVEIITVSKWLNAVSGYLSEDQKIEIEKLSFVEGISPINTKVEYASSHTEVSSESFYYSLEQMKSKEMLAAGLTGKGIKIGVIDAGFYKAHTDKYLLHLFKEFKILAQKDFINPSKKDIITENSTDADGHGRRVLDMITGYSEEEKSQMGMAVNAQFYLARTENGAREYRGEEDTWIAAMEWMDSVGVKLISTSLGYSINMDDPEDNYKISEMNGSTTKISRAAQIAVDEKGIFLVVSAGNQGGDPKWKIVSAPADAQGSLSVGATRDVYWDKIGYSSIGPDFVPYLKPNVSCYSPDGTSFSAPAVAGFVACIMQKAPDLNNKQIKRIIEKSGHLFPYGNNYIGYGVPQADKALLLLKDSNYVSPKAISKEVHGNTFKLKVDNGTSNTGVVFHKYNETIVVSQQEVTLRNSKIKKILKSIIGGKNSVKGGKIELNKKPGVARSTVVLGDAVTEIIWK